MSDVSARYLSPEQVQQIRAALAANPTRMTPQLARELGVPEAEVVRQMPATVELDVGRWEELLRAFEGLVRVHVNRVQRQRDLRGGGPVRRLQHLGRVLQRPD